VQQEHLGLFDTPSTRREIRFALLVVGMMIAVVVAILPFREAQPGEIDAFVPVVDAVVVVGELIIATMLYAQAAVFRSRALTLLASGFIFIALLLVMHALTFPGAFAEHGLFGDGSNSTAWVMIFRRLGFPLIVLLYARFALAESTAPPSAERPRARVLVWATGAVALAGAASVLAISQSQALPAMFANRTDGIFTHLTTFNLTAITLSAIAIAALFRGRRSVLDVWLMVGLAGWLVQAVLNLFLQARFSLGWYSLFLIVLVSHLCVLLALIGESNRLYARLALSTSAQAREREARMMSMDAVAAAISHEVGQPLAAVTLNAAAGLRSLTGPKPDRDVAIRSLRDTIDAGKRTFEIIKSFRLMFDNRKGTLSEFDLNDLVRETAAVLARDFAGQRISLQLELDSDLPPILANRVQIHRVLVNLLTNAIESVSAFRRGERRVIVRTTTSDNEHVLVEISDTGSGISPEQMSNIFDPFFTTKPTGSGLGLSLSRTIAEEHGGRLWATPGKPGGATFHLQLPPSGLPHTDAVEPSEAVVPAADP
jgi:signal transduction histidine kinase